MSSSHRLVSSIPIFTSPAQSLLENLSISPSQLPVPVLNRLVPTPLIVDERAILLLGGIQLREGVALVVGRNVEGGRGVLAADHKGAFYDGVVTRAVDGGGAEDVFA